MVHRAQDRRMHLCWPGACLVLWHASFALLLSWLALACKYVEVLIQISHYYVELQRLSFLLMQSNA